jgi:hypothetical protein
MSLGRHRRWEPERLFELAADQAERRWGEHRVYGPLPPDAIPLSDWLDLLRKTLNSRDADEPDEPDEPDDDVRPFPQ